MEVQSDFVEPITPALSYNNVSFWRTEDSGYHTSFTPGSVDCSEISNENLDPAVGHGQLRISGQFQVNYDVTPEANYHGARRFVRAKNILSSTQTESSPGSPIIRRGIKRPYQDDNELSPLSVPTPTSMIAGGIQKLQVSESSRSILSSCISSSESYNCSETVNNLYHLSGHALNLSYPTTPVKKICKLGCKLSPLRKSNKKLNFTMHSLSCESRGVVKHRPHQKVVRNIQFRPDQRIDIIKMLYQEKTCVLPPLMKIIEYLTNDDVCKFKSVSSVWCEVWEHVSRAKKKLEYESFLKNEKDNQENKERGLVRKNCCGNQNRSLKEVHNIMNTCVATSPLRSPPGTPRTNKFKKFAKCAQLDSRVQLPCVRCNQPSKITVEASGEEWAECTSSTCSYHFCKFCKCDRHPGKTCFMFDLDGPSPSKRKKNTNAICTKKSKRNLHRLMI